jgi:adenine-specific DNA-methyltransferase
VTEALVKELAGHQPLKAVFRDNGFASDAVKINVEQIFRQLSPTTDVKSI